MRLTIAVLFAVLASVAVAQQPTITFGYTVPPGPDLRVSAAVYDLSGALIRTIFSNIPTAPGSYTGVWDGRVDQSGPGTTPATAPTGVAYTVKVLMDDVHYTNDGHLGTTSDNWYNPTRMEDWHWVGAWRAIYVGDGRGLWLTGSTEGMFAIGWFNKADLNTVYPLNQNFFRTGINVGDMATDGNYVWLANVGQGSNAVFVTLLDVHSGTPANFTTGGIINPLGCANFPSGGGCANIAISGQVYNHNISFIDCSAPVGLNPPAPAGCSTTPANLPTGIAVQRSGNLLAVAHGSSNQIRVFDKMTGALLTTYTGITNPTRMGFTPEGLWVLGTGGVYLVQSITGTPVLSQPLAGLVNPVALGVNWATGNIAVADGGTAQQVKEFASGTHALTRTYGTAGAYSDCNPTIAKDRFLFDHTYTSGTNAPYANTFVALDNNDDLLIGDGGNAARILQIGASNAYLSGAFTMRPQYYAAVSKTMPTRVFAAVNGWLMEYNVNYDVPLQPGDPDPALGGNGAWTLAKNWGVCLSGYNLSYIDSAEQLSNGNVYGVVNGCPITGTCYYRYLFQMPSSGALRIIGPVSTAAGVGIVVRMYVNGDIGYSDYIGTAPAYTSRIHRMKLNGFDGSANPIYGADTVVASAAVNPTTQCAYNPSYGYRYRCMVPEYSGPMPNGSDVTTSGYYPVMQGLTGYADIWTSGAPSTLMMPHLAAIKTGFSGYAWTTMGEKCMGVGSTGPPDYQGSFNCHNGFGGHAAVPNVEVELGKHIFAAYDGQYATWGEQLYHFYEDGLQVGQFGNREQLMSILSPYHPFNGGNWARMVTTNYKGDIYVYVGDELTGPLHRYHVSNLSSIKEYAGSSVLTVGGTIANLVPLQAGDMGKPMVLARRRGR